MEKCLVVSLDELKTIGRENRTMMKLRINPVSGKVLEELLRIILLRIMQIIALEDNTGDLQLEFENIQQFPYIEC